MVVVPSDIVMSQSWSPTRASVMADASAVSEPPWSAAPSSLTVIQEGHVVPSAKVTSSLSSSAAVRAISRADPSSTLPALASPPSPSLDRVGASLISVSVITNVSDAVSPAPSEVVQVIA